MSEITEKNSKRGEKPLKKAIRYIPQDFYEKIEFDKVREVLVSYCKGDEGKAFYKKLVMLKSPHEVRDALSKSKEYHSSFQEDDCIPIGEYFDITRDLYYLSKENYMLDIESLFRINASIRLGHDIIVFFTQHQDYSILGRMAGNVSFSEELVNLINKVLDEEGKVRSNASPELMRISRNIQSKMRELDKEFDHLVKHYKKEKMLTDSVESYRNGRRVLSLPAEKKRQIKGVIHDESATGKTVFLEPESMMVLNNDLFELESDHKTEVNRIVRQLCSDLRVYLPIIEAYHDLIIQMDIIGSRAKWAKEIDGQFPEIQHNPILHFKDAYHPILKLKNDKEGIKTISFNLELHGKNRILLLSGPNAGGKSILMKSVVLLQVMIQCGVPIPVNASSKPGFFRQFIADIGDQQSIENDLSTYSSRLKIMAEALEKVTPHTLLVIDEFGSGTDPQFGGALAESMLNSFNKSGVYGVITTHYGNLKLFAYKNKGIVNGAMVFNEEELYPTYEMRIGKPGSSFAYEIADKSGVSKSVMQYAREKTGKNHTKIEDLLINLQREKSEIEEKLSTLTKKENELERLIGTYSQLHKELDVRRKKVKIEARENELRDSSEKNRAFENLIRELREEKKLEDAKEVASKFKKEREEIHQQVIALETSLLSNTLIDPANFKEGDYVKIGSGTDVGVIHWVRKKKAEVLFGNMAITTKIIDLRPANAPIEKKRTKSVNSTLSRNPQTHTRLDIRGLLGAEATRMVEAFMDKALLGNAHELTIVHGHGTGVLKRAVRKVVKEYNDVKEVFHPEHNAGGEGVTIVKL